MISTCTDAHPFLARDSQWKCVLSVPAFHLFFLLFLFLAVGRPIFCAHLTSDEYLRIPLPYLSITGQALTPL